MAEALVERLRAQATFVPDSRPGDVMLEAAEWIEMARVLLENVRVQGERADKYLDRIVPLNVERLGSGSDG